MGMQFEWQCRKKAVLVSSLKRGFQLLLRNEKWVHIVHLFDVRWVARYVDRCAGNRASPGVCQSGGLHTSISCDTFDW